jgi:hypothetical protein
LVEGPAPYDPEHSIEQAVRHFREYQIRLALAAFIKASMYVVNGKYMLRKPLTRQTIDRIVQVILEADEYVVPQTPQGKKKAAEAMKKLQGE